MTLHIIVVAIVMFGVGALWFTVLFGRMWSRLMAFTPEQNAKAKEGGMVQKMLVMFILNLVTVWVFFFLEPQVMSQTFGEFLKVVLLIWLGFTFPVQVGSMLWEGKSWKLVAINALHSIVSFGIVSAIVYYWG